jgi:hypothetical protein
MPETTSETITKSAPPADQPPPPPPKSVTVELQMDSNGTCFAAQLFRGAPGDTVIFEFSQAPGADIIFIGMSPFGKNIFKVGEPQTVRADAPFQSYGYIVQWENGRHVGNGGGEVP